MKKNLLLFCFLMCSIVTWAGSLKGKGNVNCFKETETAVLTIDFSKAKWEKKEDFKQWCGTDYDKRVAVSNSEFTRSFNEKSKGLKIVEAGNDAKYKIVIDVTNFERKTASFGWGRAHIKIYGTLKVVDASTGDAVCTYTLDGVSGGDDFVETDRFAKSFAELGKQLTK